jgi:D-proline reductase (dithiol) PrdB
LIARYLEQHGIPTVIMGAAKDIVERCAVPRFWFSDFPLGHSAGKPFDERSQNETLRGALGLFDSALNANTTIQSPQIWAEDDTWQSDFMDVAALSPELVEKLKKDHERTRALKAGQS